MGTIYQCKTCGGKVSKNAKVCPHCGETGEVKLTLWQKLKRATLFAIIFMIFLGWGISELGSAINEGRKNRQIIDDNNRKIEAIEAKRQAAIEARLQDERKAMEPLRDKLLKKTREEKKVIAAVWYRDGFGRSKDVLSVAVMGDGTNRDGYAQYICLLANEVGLGGKGIEVEITDAIKSINSGDLTPIGRATCR